MEICDTVGLPDACTQLVSRKEVKAAVTLHHMTILKEEMANLKKLEPILHDDFLVRQPYMLQVSLEDSRMEFRWRTGMLDNRANMGRKYTSKACSHCLAGREDGGCGGVQPALAGM